ncbi:MAG: uracil-DNA glycosylase [Pseudomonadota bacterium]
MTQRRVVTLREEWLVLLQREFDDPYMQELSAFLRQRRAAGAEIYPPASQIFAALDSLPPQDVRVVILGQDPYHNPGQAHGLCFSVNRGVPVPPSLQNIYKELSADVGLEIPRHGDLRPWAERGVLLLNSVLTVERNQPASHQKKGWERFTDKVVALLSGGDRPLVFLLWGSHAQKKGAAIDRQKHCVLSAPHPSPLSAHRGFFGSRPFSLANQFLEKSGQPSMDWSLPL